MTRVAVGLAAAALLCAGGCVLFTGSTDGYMPSEAGSAPTCMSASSCHDGGVCCLVLSSSSTSLAGTCQSSCANPSYPQLCTTDGECGDAGPCAKLTCTVDGGAGVSVPLQACGTVPGCTAAH